MQSLRPWSRGKGTLDGLIEEARFVLVTDIGLSTGIYCGVLVSDGTGALQQVVSEHGFDHAATLMFSNVLSSQNKSQKTSKNPVTFRAFRFMD